MSPLGSHILLLEPQGEIDMATAPTLKRALAVAAADGARTAVVVDLAAVSFIDSSALHALVDGQRQLRAAGGDLVITGAHALIRRVFEITGLAEALNLVESRREAVERAQTVTAAERRVGRA